MGSSVIVMTFDDMRQAQKAYNVLKSLRSEKLFKLSDAVIISKDVDGDVYIDETEDVQAKGGAITGGVAGLVVGFLVGGPIGGALLGAATGAIAGKVIDTGIPEKKVKEVAAAIEVATSALLVQVKEGNLDNLVDAMEETGGQLFELNVSDEAEKQLKEAAGHEDTELD
jgi:uncharacterized membrane protein